MKIVNSRFKEINTKYYKLLTFNIIYTDSTDAISKLKSATICQN